MSIPGYTADRSLYRAMNRYVGSTFSPASKVTVSPALATCASCDAAYNRCLACKLQYEVRDQLLSRNGFME